MKLKVYILEAEKDFSLIDNARIELLLELSNYIKSTIAQNQEINLNFICTHNSRRSHMAQLWAAKAADYYGLSNIECYSGGTEATAFNTRAVKAMQKAGFEINLEKDGENPVYEVKINKNSAIKAFSKKFDDDFNPQNNFAAVMTCSDADENCPYIPGADKRFAIKYEDPKEFDGTEIEEDKYDERCKQIAIEMLFVMKNVK
jgi:arsenate reductase